MKIVGTTVFIAMLSINTHSDEIGTSTEWESLSYLEGTSPETLQQVQLDLTLDTSVMQQRVHIDGSVRRANKASLKDHQLLREGYLDAVVFDQDIRIGQQTIRWGRSDIVSALDFSRRNFQDPLDNDNEDLGSLAVALKQYKVDSTVEVVVLPTYQYSLMPTLESPWFARLPPKTGANQSIRYTLADLDRPSLAFSNTQYGARVNAFFSGWDLGISYFNGWNDAPRYRSEITAFNENTVDVRITPFTHRIQILGSDFAANMELGTLRGEISYIDTKDRKGNNPDIDDPYFHLIFGADYVLSDAIENQDLNILVEYSKQFKTTSIEYTATDFDHIFQDAVSVRLNLDVEPVWALTVDYIQDLRNTGLFIRPNIRYRFNDQLSFDFMAEWLDGESSSFFGYYKGNRALRLRVTYDSLF